MKQSCLMPFIDIFVILGASTAMLLAVLNPEVTAYQRKVQFKNEKQQKGKSRQLFNEKFTQVEISRAGEITIEKIPVNSIGELKQHLKKLGADGVSIVSDRKTTCDVTFKVLEAVQSLGLKKMEFSLK